jgi:hypothetical protein
MTALAIWAQFTIYVGTLFGIYFLFRYIVDMIKESWFSDSLSADDIDRTLYGNFR